MECNDGFSRRNTGDKTDDMVIGDVFAIVETGSTLHLNKLQTFLYLFLIIKNEVSIEFKNDIYGHIV